MKLTKETRTALNKVMECGFDYDDAEYRYESAIYIAAMTMMKVCNSPYEFTLYSEELPPIECIFGDEKVKILNITNDDIDDAEGLSLKINIQHTSSNRTELECIFFDEINTSDMKQVIDQMRTLIEKK